MTRHENSQWRDWWFESWLSDPNARSFFVRPTLSFPWVQVNGERLLVPRDSMGIIPSAATWREMADKIDEFYAVVGDEDIDRANWEQLEPSKKSIAAVDRDSFEEEARPGYIYLMGGGGYYKIGLSVDPQVRLKQISPKMPYDIELVHTVPTGDMHGAERYLHKMFADKRVQGEWFELDDEDIDYIMNLEELCL